MRLGAPRFEHTAALLPDGRVVLGGGWSGIANNNVIVPLPLGHFDIYRPAEGWSDMLPGDDDPTIFWDAMVLMADGTIMVVGTGVDETGDDFTTAGILDPETQFWTPMPAPATVRVFSRVALLNDGRVLATGGLQFDADYEFGFMPTRETEIFDPRAGQWQEAALTNHASQSSTIVALQNGGALLVHHSDSDDDEIVAEIYDPDADVWTIASGIHGARRTAKAVVLPDGRALVVGAAISELEGLSQGTSAKISGEIYDPTTGAWASTGDMVELRLFAALTLLPDGRALASGGIAIEGAAEGPTLSEGALLSTTEIYDPDTNAWTPGPDMAEPRYDHTATALPDGSVLIAGGVTILPDIWEIYPTDTSEIISVR